MALLTVTAIVLAQAVPPPALPPPPSLDDPMLVPMAATDVNVSTWAEALDYVRARSTDLRAAYADVARAEAQSRVALAGTLPTLTATGVATHNFVTNDTLQIIGANGLQPVFSEFTTPTPNFATGQILAVQPLLNVRAWDSIGIAKENVRAAKLSVEDLKRTIALNVANAIVAVVTAERISELNRVGLRNALSRLELTRRRKELGAGTGLDIVRAQQDAENARATLVTGDESLRQSREALGLALGLPRQVGVPRDVRIDGLERSALAACKAVSSLDERADVAAARQRLHVASRGIDNAKYQMLPTVNAQSGVSTTTIDTGAAPNTTWNIQGVLTIPLFDGGVRYGQMRDARAQADGAAQALESLRRTATVQLAQARRGVEVAEQSRKVAADTRALAAEADRLVRTAYIEGQGTSLDLVTAAAALRQAEIQLALREFDLVRARVLAVLQLATCPW